MVEAITLAVIAKKAAELLASTKNGRKFIGYVIGIAIFIVLLPVIVLMGLFGGLSQGGELLGNEILSQLPPEDMAMLESMDITVTNIQTVFSQYGLTESDSKKATELYLNYLVGREQEDYFYDNLACCFLNTSNYYDVYTLTEMIFGVSIPLEVRQRLDELYGETFIRHGYY